ncbi:MAG: sigma-54-dependent Fis family transcriptional regulator, partial [Thermoguttaceae bacterium]|nr:sigma-54-dependent Fis family transcriptional regulator [Thermoguttaceae bacterium]
YTPEAMELLRRYDWPGNVRQLANVVEHSMILAGSLPIGKDALPSQFFGSGGPRREASAGGGLEELMAFDAGKTLRDLEREAIIQAVNRNGGNKAKAAEELGISLKTLYNKLNQLQDKK